MTSTLLQYSGKKSEAVSRLEYLIVIKRMTVHSQSHIYLFKMYLNGRFVKYLILLSTWEWANMLALCNICIYLLLEIN